MDIRKIRKLIELINETGVGEIEVKSGEESVRISRLPNQTSPPATTTVTPVQQVPTPAETTTPHKEFKEESNKDLLSTSEEKPGHAVKAPMVGTIYLAPKPGAKPFVEVGQRVAVGDTLCLIEAMKMFNKIEADQSGVINARLVENDQPVEYDQTLFIIEPDE